MGIRSAKVSEVRQSFSDFFTDAVHKDQPIQLLRHDKERAFLLGERFLQYLVAASKPASDTYEILIEEDGSVVIQYRPLDLVGNGADQREALLDVLEQSRSYAEIFFDDLVLYLRDPKRRLHMPLLLATFLFEHNGDLARYLGLPEIPGLE